MHLPQKVVGIEQIGDEQVNHTKTDTRPILSFAWVVFLSAIVLIVTEATK